ncbi:hypothetical protein CTEST_06110 [Corynebacterium testudinoris]|uniref:Uncharacterized protein n=1 Tax=Corynebacterium testudinoris TaxID=136857 RepID=A0A0G3H5M7_9CORY|nr:hypothetical protein CTEST_06110 [Corynebacterium testudinoris]
MVGASVAVASRIRLVKCVEEVTVVFCAGYKADGQVVSWVFALAYDPMCSGRVF